LPGAALETFRLEVYAMTLEQLRVALKGVSAYRNIMDTWEMEVFTNLLDALRRGDGDGAVDMYTRLFYLLRQGQWPSLGHWMLDKLKYEEAPYPIMLAERRQDPALTDAARRDIALFSALSQVECSELLDAMAGLMNGADEVALLNTLPQWEACAPFDFDQLTAFYNTNGAGMYAQYRAFLWQDGQLVPVTDPDCPKPEEMIGYTLQRQQVIDNTRAMLAGSLVNNVLLYGNSGTGKSATVKSLLSVPGFDDLRLIEVGKESLSDMPILIRRLAGKRHKFILFIDDLAFDQDDRTYSTLKTILEGGLEKRPANVAIYATSNRRNLVRQTFSDRAGDEVDASETIEEKTSLADRFGLRIPYLSLDKKDYLELVDRLAELYHVTLEPAALHQQAMSWELRHHGRSPRTARQFIASLF
jgi:hypothetical protein